MHNDYSTCYIRTHRIYVRPGILYRSSLASCHTAHAWGSLKKIGISARWRGPHRGVLTQALQVQSLKAPLFPTFKGCQYEVHTKLTNWYSYS